MKNQAKKFDGWQSLWLLLSSNIFIFSTEIYGSEITNEWASFPLQAAKSLFGPLK
jgi:hypothetical protein